MSYCSLCNKQIMNEEFLPQGRVLFNSPLCTDCAMALRMMQKYASEGDSRFTDYREYLFSKGNWADPTTFQHITGICAQSAEQFSKVKRKQTLVTLDIIIAIALFFMLGGLCWIKGICTCSACGKHFLGTTYTPDNETHILCFDCAYDYKKGLIALDEGIKDTEGNYLNGNV